MLTTPLLNHYALAPRTWDEMYDDDKVRFQYRNVFDFLQRIPADELSKKEELAKKTFYEPGYYVYSVFQW